jgi:hypothetical protein
MTPPSITAVENDSPYICEMLATNIAQAAELPRSDLGRGSSRRHHLPRIDDAIELRLRDKS